MTDLTAELLPKLKAHRIPGLDLGSNFVYPNYEGQSILNIPGSISHFLGAPSFGAPPFHEDILSRLGGPYQRVVLLLVDALAMQRLQVWINEPEFAVWKRLAATGMLAPLTSVSPSTTCAALTSVWTGRSPGEHGIVGYELFLKEYGLVANMIQHSPFALRGPAGALKQAGFDPVEFLGQPTLGSHLAASGIKAHAFQHGGILGSGLSEMFFADVKTHGFLSPADLWISFRQQFTTYPNERAYFWVYWSDVDTLSHRFGPDDERVRAGFASFSQDFERYFLDATPAAQRKDTLFILVADHGQIHTEKDAHYELSNHPNLTRRLHMLPTGENRLAYLYIKPGQTEAVREYIEKTWPNQFAVIDSSYAQEVGLFGQGRSSPRLADRIGDLVVVAKGNAYWWWAAKDNPLIGRHGGLDPQEMLVPLLAAPLADV